MDESRVMRESGNVYADLSFDDPELEQANANLARRISEVIEARGLTQTVSAELLGVPSSNLSKIVQSRLGEFSMERLIRLLRRFDQDVRIVVSPSDQPGRLIATILGSDERAIAAVTPIKMRAAQFP